MGDERREILRYSRVVSISMEKGHEKPFIFWTKPYYNQHSSTTALTGKYIL